MTTLSLSLIADQIASAIVEAPNAREGCAHKRRQWAAVILPLLEDAVLQIVVGGAVPEIAGRPTL